MSEISRNKPITDLLWELHLKVVAKADAIEPGSIEDARFFSLALCGEAGELANIIKKEWRGDFAMDERLEDIEGELADIVFYTFLLSRCLGVDIDGAMQKKFKVIKERWDTFENTHNKS